MIIKNKLTIAFLALGSFFQINAQEGESVTESTETKKEKVINFMAVGDIMLGTTFPNASYLPAKGVYPFKDVQNVFEKADVLFGNLEGTLTDTGKNAKRCKDPSKCYSFKSPQAFGNHFKKAGFDVVSIANNHIGDFGSIGIKNTIKTLDDLGIENAGVLSKPITTFEKDGVKYGFIAFAPNKDCLKLNNVSKGIQLVKSLNNKVDIVIVSFHGGAEGTKHKNITRKTEYFYGENRGNVHSFAHKMIDAGADLILGHGPHVPRAIEVYKGKFIAYSMGNFATYKRFSMSGSKAYSPIFELKLKENGDFIDGKIHSALQTKTRYPFIDASEKAYKEIKTLTLQDFPENKIKFNDNGVIELK
ncbi:CapA family protein [Tenacibaculum sp. M341]|uniref:CapA family protein n=1 Tax=Tenacibaculum sp. M341 TaxID=2530339 RepID=UPI00104FD3D5|nr:CapA family protein [Tenacibaculum sp. M341]TCI93544.1 CapA family protein [Tenacibaculum sp. M341]